MMGVQEADRACLDWKKEAKGVALEQLVGRWV